MEYIYAALLLHKVGKQINEESVKNVVQATGVAPDAVKVKALVAALSEVNIDDAIKTAGPVAPVAVASQAPAATPSPEKGEGKGAKPKEEKKEEEALEGLSSLFG